MTKKNIIIDRLAALRAFMEKNALEAFIVPSTDAHLSEYPASHWESRVWISGFTGSAGTIVVTKDKAGLWTDSRYFLQGSQQLEGSTIDLFKEGLPETPSITEWLPQVLSKGAAVGIDAQVYAAKEAFILQEELKRKGLVLKTDKDPFAHIWTDRPAIPTNPIFILPEKYSGASAHHKAERICDALDKVGADSIIAASLDSIAWLYNIRGNDVKCNPVAVCFAYVSRKESVLFIDPKKLTTEVIEYLEAQNVKIADYNKFFDYISKLDETICLESAKVTLKILQTIKPSCTIIDIPSPIDLMKACKNETELNGIRNAMIKDGVALIQFFMWLENNVAKGSVREIDIPAKLNEFRSKQELYVGESFDTIAGYGPNGAIVHYKVSEESSLTLKPEGFVLVDTGAQYFDGTTDITRTMALGHPSEQMQEDYTLVLKGHIAISTSVFPQGTRGAQLDALARMPLWKRGLNYLHGTGHGVGHFLNVHEGPQSIRLNENPTTLEIGMVTSNEPGLYRDGEYGIRLENLIAVKQDMTTEFGKFYNFEYLTLCPFDTRPINKNLLSESEINWLNSYHKYVYSKLSPFLSHEEREWLMEKTHEI